MNSQALWVIIIVVVVVVFWMSQTREGIHLKEKKGSCEFSFCFGTVEGARWACDSYAKGKDAKDCSQIVHRLWQNCLHKTDKCP